jgi:hypothetical protein
MLGFCTDERFQQGAFIFRRCRYGIERSYGNVAGVVGSGFGGVKFRFSEARELAYCT